jgi:hypothetical protein
MEPSTNLGYGILALREFTCPSTELKVLQSACRFVESIVASVAEYPA